MKTREIRTVRKLLFFSFRLIRATAYPRTAESSRTMSEIMKKSRMPQIRRAAEELLSGKTAATILSECESDQERQDISSLFAVDTEITAENAAFLVEQCLSTIRLQRRQKQIDALRGSLDSMEPEEKKKALAELVTLSKEMTSIKKTMQ